MNGRKINFSPGPSKLPLEVLERIKTDLPVYQKTGVSILEISHRSAEFTHVKNETEKILRDLLSIPSDYEVLFLPGGGTGQFAAIPLNLSAFSTGDKPSADYAVTGDWSKKALVEGRRFLVAHNATPQIHTFNSVPDSRSWQVNADSAYLYYCANETINGVEFHSVPEVHTKSTLVADVSSNFLTKPFNIAKHGVVFGGVQKNLGPAGLCVVIVRKDLVGKAAKYCPSILDFHEQHKMGSVYNTPPVFNIYATKLVLEWIRDQGGLDAMDHFCKIKSELIYKVIDDSLGFYSCPVDLNHRSRVNIPFRIGTPQTSDRDKLEKDFLKGAEELELLGLKGHRSVGGIRASLYNAVTVEETERLADYMSNFLEMDRENIKEE